MPATDIHRRTIAAKRGKQGSLKKGVPVLSLSLSAVHLDENAESITILAVHKAD
ncbi:hypothetical protein [Rhizobium herbae]|uniref:Uncharacterized protein n=1 Tax=Rhizobium herbae TaxID=508661 RepID=A0ABS4EQY4_9HYPH|nr:hypothetical protein [Rhizobium herbae]MBP1860343.1 hypothetical protein [Rhizobium herbae]